jgi:DNA (cytosine-5)-methyltransferase 1
MPAPQSVSEPIRVLDLFAGCGGLTEGFHQFRPAAPTTGPVFRSVGAVEWNPAAAASYAKNFGATSKRYPISEPPEIFCGDIVDWEPHWEPGAIDVVVGGPPCQGFSALNRNKVGAERNELWQQFIRVVVAVQPKVFVIENVDRFVRSPEFVDLKKRVGNGDLKNYALRDAPGTKEEDNPQQRDRRYLLNAADYGARQARRRAIVIGVRTDVDLRVDRMQYPEPTHSKEPLQHQAEIEGLHVPVGQEPWLTVDDIFSSTDDRPSSGTSLPDRTSYVAEAGGNFSGPYRTSDLHITRNPEPISLARYGAIPPGGNRKDLTGKFACRFEDGSMILLKKIGALRSDDGKLALLGHYVEVTKGASTPGTYSVSRHDLEPTPVPGQPGRNKSQTYGVTLRDGVRERRAILEYLSTDSWDNHNAGSGDVMGRLRRKAPSVTIRTEFFKPEKGRYLHPTKDRPITHYEAAALQGFPEDFLWCGSKIEIAKQIGNAVPIPLGIAIAGAIHAYLRPTSS